MRRRVGAMNALGLAAAIAIGAATAAHGCTDFDGAEALLPQGGGGGPAGSGAGHGAGSSAASGGAGGASTTGAAGAGTAGASSSSTQGAGAGGVGPGGGGAGGGAGGSPHEDCTNAVDDDGDGNIDCEDPACGGFSCSPAVPPGFSGPDAFYAGENPPPCEAGYTTSQDGGTVATSPGGCHPCDCGMPHGGGCEFPATQYFNAIACSGSSVPNQIVSAACTSMSGQSWDVQMTPNPTWVCDPTGGGTDGTPDWGASAARLCTGATAGAGCPNQGVCAPNLSATFSHGCVHAPDDVACPEGFPNKTLMFTAFDDTRSCDPCVCAPARGTCNGGLFEYNSSTCSVGSTPTGFGCVTGYAGLQWVGTEDPPIACQASGGVPHGGVTGAGALTVCCP